MKSVFKQWLLHFLFSIRLVTGAILLLNIPIVFAHG